MKKGVVVILVSLIFLGIFVISLNGVIASFGSSLDNNLISMWTFDSADGSTADKLIDLTGRNNGTASGVTQIEGFRGEAYNASGSGLVTISNEQEFDFPLKSTISISLWFFGRNNVQNLIYKHKEDYSAPSNPANNNFRIDLSSDNRVRFSYYTMQYALGHPTGTVDVYRNLWVYNSNNFVTLPLTLTDSWNNLIVTYNYSNCSSISVYLNGIKVGGSWEKVSWPHTSTCGGCIGYTCGADGTQWFHYTTPTPLPNNAPLKILKSDEIVDEVAIWNRTLALEEVVELYEYYSFICGNGIKEETEDCDDGNTTSGDGCSALCTFESGYNCTENDSGTSVCSLILTTRTNATCSGSVPLNALINDPVLNGNFTQTYNLTQLKWLPENKTFTFSTTSGECKFKCNTSYSWNSSSQICYSPTVTNFTLVTPSLRFCSDYDTLITCISAPLEVVKRTLGTAGGYCGLTWQSSIDKCNYSVDCLCVWNGTKCNTARASYNPLADSCNSNQGYCDIVQQLPKNNCNTSLNNIILSTTARWYGSGASLYCKNETAVFSCPSVAKLSFFSPFGFLIGLLVISVVYIFRYKIKLKL